MKWQYDTALWIWIGIGIAAMLLLFFLQAPYGRHIKSKGWGPLIPNRLGWIAMELPALLVFPLVFLSQTDSISDVHILVLALWGLHYVHRALIFPFRTRTSGKQMPLSIPFMAIFFNTVNGFFLGYYLSHFTIFPAGYLLQPLPWIGTGVFLIGYAINLDSDTRLINLRAPGETGYKIPRGGLYRWLSAPNYFGEVVEWTGFLILLGNLPALAFLLWTISNLLPRALSNHKWYKDKFPDYPPQRKAILPFLL